MANWRKAVPKIGGVDFGDFERLGPISTVFGYDRGAPIDRLYIENFLESHRLDIKGRVLEIGDNEYTRRFGGERVKTGEVLHKKSGTSGATIVADLADAPTIPNDTFDCIILTQVLELVYDLKGAVATIFRILKPNGVALITVPGISNIDHGEWRNEWMWSFTTGSLAKLLRESFPAEMIAVSSCGNVFVATAFLHGLSQEDIAACDHVAVNDPHYQVTVIARARKPVA